MADTDVFGIVSIVLAAAGGGYLLWARLLKPGERGAAPVQPVRADDPAAETIPPVLRPESEIPPKMLAKREAVAKGASSRPPPLPSRRPEGATSAPPPASVRPEHAPAEVVERRELAPSSRAIPKFPSLGIGASTEPAKLPASVKAAEPRTAETTSGGAPSTAEAAKHAVQAEGIDAAKARVPGDSVDAGKSAGLAKKVDPEAVRAAPGASTTELTAPRSAPAVPAKRKDAFADLPRLDAEEDDELEPTKVGRVDRSAIQPVLEKIVFDEGADSEDPAEATPPFVVYAYAQTDPGKRRKQNQDSHLVLDDQSLFVVADGMGGHRGGQHASMLAVKTINDAFSQKNFEAAPHADVPLPASELARAIQMANSAILEEAKDRPELTGMGTTLCAARFTPKTQRLYIGHVGDSRCYRVRDGVMKQMTTDHTMADYGVAGPEGSHLSRALGVWPTVPVDVIMAKPKLGDVYLICSDGLTRMIPDGTIATQLLHEEDSKAAVERLVFFANAHGGKDNITVILIRIVEPGWAPNRAS